MKTDIYLIAEFKTYDEDLIVEVPKDKEFYDGTELDVHDTKHDEVIVEQYQEIDDEIVESELDEDDEEVDGIDEIYIFDMNEHDSDDLHEDFGYWEVKTEYGFFPDIEEGMDFVSDLLQMLEEDERVGLYVDESRVAKFSLLKIYSSDVVV